MLRTGETTEVFLLEPFCSNFTWVLELGLTAFAEWSWLKRSWVLLAACEVIKFPDELFVSPRTYPFPLKGINSCVSPLLGLPAKEANKIFPWLKILSQIILILSQRIVFQNEEILFYSNFDSRTYLLMKDHLSSRSALYWEHRGQKAASCLRNVFYHAKTNHKVISPWNSLSGHV